MRSIYDFVPTPIVCLPMDDNTANPFVALLNGTPTQLIENGNFATVPNINTDWSVGAYWSYDAVNEEMDINYGSTAYLWHIFMPIAEHTYLVTFPVKNYVGGTIAPGLGGVLGTARSANGTYTELITAITTDAFCFKGVAANLSIDNVFCIDLALFPNTGVFIDATGDPWTNAHSVVDEGERVLSLDGDDDCIEVFDEGSCEFGPNDQDFSAWIRFKRAGTGGAYLFDKRDGSGDGWGLNFLSTNKLRFVLNGVSLTGAREITDTDRHLAMVAVNRTGNAQIYLDGVADGSPANVSGQAMDIANNLLIGVMYDGTTENFNGLLIEAGIVNQALTPGQAKKLYDPQGKDSIYGPRPNRIYEINIR